MTAAEKRAEKTAKFYELIVPPASPEESHFRHSHWQPRRQKILQFMRDCFTSVFTLNRFEECGSGCTIEWSATEKKYRLCASYCKSRHCEPCMRAKGNKLAANLRNKIKDDVESTYRFITLTLLHNDAPLAQQIARLYAAFRKMRNSDEWKYGVHIAEELKGERDRAKREARKRRTRAQILEQYQHQGQTGGAAVLEVKRSKDGRRWHPHLHILSAGSYLDKHDLSRMWHKATGDSFIVDIAALRDQKDLCHYLSKYVAKGTSPTVWENADTAQEWLAASAGVRMALTFGTWRGYALMKSQSTTDDWKPVATYNAMLAAARRGEEWAVAIMINICPSEDPEEVRRRYQLGRDGG
jgi:hypothetical protein